MPEDKDYKEVLSGTVDEVKKRVRELDSPDYKELLKIEKEGDDRSTLKEFLSNKIDSVKSDGEDQEEAEDDSEEESVTEEPEETADTQDVAPEGGMSGKKLLLLGGIAGLMIGLLFGYALSPGAASQGNPSEAQNAVEQLMAGQNVNGTVDVGSPTREHGMYLFNVSVEQNTPNGTQTGNQAFYVTQDAELLIPVISNPFIGNIPINIQDALNRQAQQQQQSQPPQPPQAPEQ